jgi:retinol dehydrogenase 12
LPPFNLLEAAAPSRIVNVSSRRHAAARLDFDDLQSARRYSGIGAYGQSKLCLLLFTYELARRLETTGVTVNAMHPGFVGTGFGERGNGLMSLVLRVAHRFAATPAKGQLSCRQRRDRQVLLSRASHRVISPVP